MTASVRTLVVAIAIAAFAGTAAAADMQKVLRTYRIENIIVHPWVEGYKYNTFDPHPRMLLDLDLPQRQRATR